ncbi:hypothetical protein ALC60_08135 [Trachymyrmex zeteki]|uniref:Uncharacterized protein n=1 Tax=Mycetomoellerius zeteki TaxID=64791 RepID=A0A151WXU4_9HYME|nr:hypothetical protein ALC60_08135 [Trachymyrmex zeteki]
MARRVRALFRLQSRVAGQVLLQGGEALLQKRLLQSLITVAAPRCGEFNFAAAVFCGSQAAGEEEVLASFVTTGSDERSPL